MNGRKLKALLIVSVAAIALLGLATGSGTAANLLANSEFENPVMSNAGPTYEWLYPGNWNVTHQLVFLGAYAYDLGEARNTSYADRGLPVVYSGVDSVRVETDRTGNIAGNTPQKMTLWQEIPVAASASFSASVWVLPWDNASNPAGNHQQGFGKSVYDEAALVIEELNDAGVVTTTHALIEGQNKLTTAKSTYYQLTDNFTTLSTTQKIRFKLRTYIMENLWAGHVSWDRAVLDGPPPPYNITGTVVSGASPLVGATVTAGGVSASTNGAGVYTLTGVSGDVTVRASKAGYYAQGKAQASVSGGGTVTVGFDLAAVGGNLLLNAGFDDGPLNKWLPSTYNGVVEPNLFAQFGPNANYIYSASKGRAGIYQYASVLPNQAYQAACKYNSGLFPDIGVKSIQLQIQEYNSSMQLIGAQAAVGTMAGTGWRDLSRSFTTKPTTAVVRIGGYGEFDYGMVNLDTLSLVGPAGPVITLPPANAPSLMGYVRSGGLPLPGALVQAVQGSYSAYTDANGLYQIVAPMGATYSLRASKDGYYAQRVTVTAPIDQSFDLVAKDGNLLIDAGFDDGWLTNGGWVMSIGNGSLDPATAGTLWGGGAMYGIVDSGNEGVAHLAGTDMESSVIQVVRVQPNTSYSAAVRTIVCHKPGVSTTWGSDLEQFMALRIYELDANGGQLSSAQQMTNGNDNMTWETLSIPTYTTSADAQYIMIEGYTTSWEGSYGMLNNNWQYPEWDSFEVKGDPGPSTTIGDAKKLADGEYGAVLGRIVTCAFTVGGMSYAYCMENDASAGIAVICPTGLPGGEMRAGDCIIAIGPMQTINGERVLDARTSFFRRGPELNRQFFNRRSPVPAPLGMTSRAAGEALSEGRYALLWGSVGSVDDVAGTFTMTDGGVSLKSYQPTTGPVAVLGDYVVVTGAIGAELVGLQRVPVLRAAKVMKIN